MVKFPKIKKKANAFLVREEGKISKKEIIRGGVLLTGAAGVILESDSVEGWTDRDSHSWSKANDNTSAKHTSHHTSY